MKLKIKNDDNVYTWHGCTELPPSDFDRKDFYILRSLSFTNEAYNTLQFTFFLISDTSNLSLKLENPK